MGEKAEMFDVHDMLTSVGKLGTVYYTACTVLLCDFRNRRAFVC